MRKILPYLLAALFLCAAFPLKAQTIKVHGTVFEEETREPLPFAGVYFEGTTIGTTTDEKGRFSLETGALASGQLTAYLVGYLPQGVLVKAGKEMEINFMLKLDRKNLNAAYVRPDNHYMKYILGQIDAHRRRNNPETRRAYTCETYTKTQADLKNPELLGPILKGLKVVDPYMEVNENGQKVLPAMFAESYGKRYHSVLPEIDKEEILATRISGLLDNNVVEPYTGSTYLKPNFYESFVNVIDIKIASPVSPAGQVFYNYFLVDSLQVDGRKTYVIRFHPKKLVSTPIFDGEMQIDAEDFAVRKMHVVLDNAEAVNWVRALEIDQVNKRLPDGSWFYDNDRIFLDFSLTVKKLSKVIALIGRRNLTWGVPDFDPPVIPEKVMMGDQAVVNKPVAHADDDFWASHRADPLSDTEQGIYDMIDDVQRQPLYKFGFKVADMLSTGYIPINDKIGIGTYSNFISFNDVEGLRTSIGFQTKKDLSRDWRLTAKIAYGWKDKKFKGTARFEYIFSRLPWRKLDIKYRHDSAQLGKSNAPFLDEGNILSSVTARRGMNKYMPITELTVKYEREWRAGFTNTIGLEHKRIFANLNVPMVRPDGTEIPSVAVNQLHYTARFSWKENVLRPIYNMDFVQSDYPIVTVDLIGAKKGLMVNDVDYLRSELSVSWRLKTPPVGLANIRLNAGKIFGAVPYPLLKLHEGNASFLYDPVSFSCMRYYEFASDTWVTFSYEHHFGGFFLGKIPLIKELNWREHAFVKTAYGILTPKNDGSVEGTQAPLLFPEGMSALNTPYVEVGAGISNIFHVLRVTGVWRLTHRLTPEENPSLLGPNFTINLGFKLEF